MQRGRALLVGVAMAVVAGFIPASADTPTAPPPDPCGSATTLSSCEMPRPVCTHAINDIAGDGAPAYISGENTSAETGTGNALDIRAVDLRVKQDYVEVYLGLTSIPNPSTMAAYESTYRYIVSFNDGTKVITFTAEAKNPNPPASLDYPSDSTKYPDADVAGASWTGTTAIFVAGATSSDLAWLIMTTPRARLENALGKAVATNDVFTNIAAHTYVEHPQDSRLQTTADSTIQTGTQAQQIASDDWCFGPPPTVTQSLTVPAAVYHHSTPLSAVLLDQDGKPVANEPINFTVQDGKSTTVTGKTDANGLAKATYGPVNVAAGSYPVTATFPGDGTTYKTSSMTGTLKVSAQRTVFTALKVTKPSAKSRLVTTTLLDDLNKPIAGARVDWYVNGKKAASMTTDKSGRVTFRTGKPGQTVQARYAGKSGMLLPAVSKSAKL